MILDLQLVTAWQALSPERFDALWRLLPSDFFTPRRFGPYEPPRIPHDAMRSEEAFAALRDHESILVSGGRTSFFRGSPYDAIVLWTVHFDASDHQKIDDAVVNAVVRLIDQF